MQKGRKGINIVEKNLYKKGDKNECKDKYINIRRINE